MKPETRRLKEAEARIERLENILFDIATYNTKCNYVYLSSVWNAMEKYNLVNKVELKPKMPYRQKIIDKRKKKQWVQHSGQ